ncbi:hypothetical protein CA264_09200 [Pontibacter actiniarum]|uniref:Uncharacterized protein n=2 Tax=Pontibacter actiniarum TaxID=323450 RepID=A0A1X9YRY4_9BACT|nr:hypothetical protein CA264_09200 [Pontibacter actiniarum]
MRDDRENRYFRGDTDRNDSRFMREYEARFRGQEHPRSHSDRRGNDYGNEGSYRSRDYGMEDNYYENTRRDRRSLGDIRQGYGFSSFGDASDSYENDMHDMQRERNARYDQGYGNGRLSGYSGSAFGGANYSAHGGYGGAADYGAMSGARGNMEDYVSSSGYGGGGYGHMYSNRGVPDFGNSRRSSDEEGYSGRELGNTYTNRYYDSDPGGQRSPGSNRRQRGASDRGYDTGERNFYNRGDRTDRGGYINKDMNY